MDSIQIAWLAGLLEGEGCFYFLRTPKISLSMTDEDVIKRVSELWGKPYRRSEPRGTQKKPVFTTEIHGAKSLAIMELVAPLMGARRSAKILEVKARAASRPGIARGERAGHAKLTDIQAEEIRAFYVRGSRNKDIRSSALAKKFGVSQAAIIYCVNHRKSATLVKR